MDIEGLYSNEFYTKDLTQQEFEDLVKEDNHDISISEVAFSSSMLGSLEELIDGDFTENDPREI